MRDVLLVTIDSLRADHVGCFGYDRPTSPALDQFASNGAKFTNTFAHACSTRRSFPSILTSVYPTMYGGYERVSDSQTLISEVFQQESYQTAGFHSNLYLSAEFGYDRGFDEIYDSKSDPSLIARIRQVVKSEFDSSNILYRLLKKAYDSAERNAGANIGSAYTNASDITDYALEWVRDTDPGSPIFLWVHYMDVHHPYTPPETHQTVFRDTPISNRRSVRLRRKMLETPEEVTDTELDDILDLYDAEIRYVDTEIRRLVEGVSARRTDPIVAITADHGDEFRDHGRFSHHSTFYDEVIHVPFICSGIGDGNTYDNLVGLVDIPPSLLALADLPIPERYHGESVTPLFDGEKRDRTAVIGCSPHCFYRDRRWKYIADDPQLYDLNDDTEETKNVADSHADILDDIERRIAEHKQTVSATEERLEEVDMDERTKERLRQLGYRE